jgi:hypothetical protein
MSAMQPEPKDPNTAFVVEFVGGFFGLLGLGYMYTGRTDEGVVRLIIWFLVLGGAWLTTILLTGVVVGFCLIPLALGLQVGVPLWSATSLKKSLLAASNPPPGP